MRNSEGSKRQLPSWMMQAGVNHVSNSKSVVETNCSVEKGDIITENAGNGTKENAMIDQKRETLKRKSKLNAKCEAKRRRNFSEHDGSGDDIVQKKKKKIGVRSRDRASRPSRKKHQDLEDPSHDSCVVNPVQASSDDDVELTVEDLIAIAKQYVKDYEDEKRQETSSRQRESNLQVTAEGEYGTTLDNCCKSTKSWETLCNPTPTATCESIATSFYETGHPAQDMLELFLGPVLKKTLEIEEELKKKKSIADSLEVTHDFTRQSQDDLVGEEMAPLMKKRSTLKDKVAMFLD